MKETTQDFDETPKVEVECLTVEESHELFNSIALRDLGVTREEFLENLSRGEYTGSECESSVAGLLMLLPFATAEPD